ncbi:hypothetical protein [Paraburkholderia sp. SIMBA_054]|uniref:hypothetical protein n=1 Tax=Paraburkholderia sp. SIMBA_054 TaxID=3085795 RepID=UPI00397E1E75
MNLKLIASGAIAIALLGGCTDLIVSKSPPATGAKGFVYSLPMGRVYVQAARKTVTATDVENAKADLKAANDLITKDSKAVTDAIDSDTKAAAQAKLKQDTSAAADAKQTSDSLHEGDVNETLSFTALDVVADGDARYIGDLEHNWTRDDSMKLSIVNGLLNTSTVTSTDQTPNIIVTLADTVITLGTGARLYTLNLNRNVRTQKKLAQPCDSYSYARIFDPIDSDKVSDINKELAGLGAGFVLSVSPPGLHREKPAPQPTPSGGIVYRAAIPVTVTLEKQDPTTAEKDANGTKTGKLVACEVTSSPPAQAWQIVVPDSSSHYVAPSIAGPFTTTALTYGFTNGMLTDYTMQRPSELAAIAGIPVRIANDIMTIPTQLLQMRVNYDTAKVASINGDASVKAAQIQQAATLATAETAVVNAQTALETARIGSPTSIANAQTALESALQQLRAARSSAATTGTAGTSP